MRQSGSNVQMMNLRPLIESIAEGRIALPEFQRDFDWSESDVKALLATAFSGWPAGSLLLLDANDSIFKLRGFDGGPNIANKPAYAVLDGQQRLTSLYQAFYQKGTYVFAIRWDEELGDDLEERIVAVKRPAWNKQFSALQQQLANRIIPLYNLKSASEFFEWRDSIIDIADDKDLIRCQLSSIYKKSLNKIHDYEFPAVIIDSSTEPEAIARIFERVNKTGMRLNAFDLMVAKTYGVNWNLRQKWEEARTDNRPVGLFLEEDGMSVLQALALRERRDVRQAAVLSLSKAVVQNEWEALIDAAETAIIFAIRECGAIKKEFFPYSNMMAPLIALSAEQSLLPNRRIVREWFFYVAFMGALDAAANTRIAAYYAQLRHGRFFPPDRFARFLLLEEATRKSNRSAYNGFLCVLANLVYESATESDEGILYDDLQASPLASAEECFSVIKDHFFVTSANDISRSIINTVLVPRKYAPSFENLPLDKSIEFADENGFGKLLRSQLMVSGFQSGMPIFAFFQVRAAEVTNVIRHYMPADAELSIHSEFTGIYVSSEDAEVPF